MVVHRDLFGGMAATQVYLPLGTSEKDKINQECVKLGHIFFNQVYHTVSLLWIFRSEKLG